MRLDAPTLLIATTLVTAVLGSLFLLAWSQDRGTRALLVWGIAHLIGATASILIALRGLTPNWLSIGVGNAMMIGAYGMIWSGTRAFEGRRPMFWLAAAAGGLWVLACLVPAFYASVQARVILASLLAGGFCTYGAVEIWRGRADTLVSRYPAAALLGAYAALYLVRIPVTLAFPLPPDAMPLSTPWLAVTCLVNMMITVAIAFTFIGLTKERSERHQRLAAETDALTGVANRRAFVARTETMLAAGRGNVVVVLFDLDHFKGINDSHGHEVGDAVLVGFCCLVREVLPAGTLLGRLGGEEFACVLDGASSAQAFTLAGRVREALGRLAVPSLPTLSIGVSVGIAASQTWGRDFDTLLRHADAALYRAKRNGRNRVEVSDRAKGGINGNTKERAA